MTNNVGFQITDVYLDFSCHFLRGHCMFSLNVLYYTSFSGNITICFLNFNTRFLLFHNFEGKYSACSPIK